MVWSNGCYPIPIASYSMKNLFTKTGRGFCILFFFLLLFTCSHAQVNELYTDYGGYWKSASGSINPVRPNNSNNVIAFNYNGTVYSTGVKDSALTNRGVSFTPGLFKAMPFTSVGGSIGSGTATYIALGTLYDGVNNGYSTPLPTVRILDVLTDGVHGLDIGTGVTNVPSNARFTYEISNIDTVFINDAVPDILYTQTAQPAGAGDSLYFVNSSGVVVGNRVHVGWTGVSAVGEYICDLYNLSYTTGDAAVITSGSAINQVKDLRLVGLKMSEFGITAANSGSVVRLIVKPGGQSDPAFMAYNANALNISSPIITVQPVTQVVCPNTGSDATFSVTATGIGLLYQWKKNGVAIPGAVSAIYTITNVDSADAGMYEVTVTNAAGSITSQMVYLNTAIITQPSPATQTIATGNSVSLSVSAQNATGFQWRRNGVNIGGAVSATYIINPLTTSNDGSYTVNVINANSGGCASIESNAVVVTAATILYCKSSGALTVITNWGVNTNGTGSRPLNFNRSEHVFKVSNQANAATGGNLTIAGTLDLVNSKVTVTAGSTLTAGQITRTGNGTISGTNTSNLTVSNSSDLYFTTGAEVLKNLTINGGVVNLHTPLNITAGSAPGTLVVSAGNFNTNDQLTIKSDANGTAAVGSSAGSINGAVTVERYIPARRAWRIITAPLTTVDAPTIHAAWQEGASSSTADPSPGYGTHVTGGAVINGFDISPTNSTSLKYFSGNNWYALPNTNATPVTQHDAYMFFIRGNRSYTITTTQTSTTALSTVLRSKGNLKQGNQPAKAVAASGYTLIGNPYASGIDFSLVYAASSNIKNRFRMWYPGLAGENGVGGYVLLDWNGSGYTATPSVGVNSIIQSGEGFFVESNDGINPGSLVIRESHKNNSTNNTLPFGRPARWNDGRIRIDLNIVKADSTLAIADGVLVRYDEAYDDLVDRDDAVKFGNSGENLSIVTGTGNQNLTVERRTLPDMDDSIQLKISNLVNTNYNFDIEVSNLLQAGVIPVLKDAYLQQEKYLPAAGITNYPFSVTADPLSKASNRFAIVFRSFAVLPVSFQQVKAFSTGEAAVKVQWDISNERDVRSYEVQKQQDGTYQTIGQVAANAHTAATASYSYTDSQAVKGQNIYRVAALDQNGSIRYSQAVTVNIKANQRGDVFVYPNPVTGNVINLSDIQQGQYNYQLFTPQGQVAASGEFHSNSISQAVIQLTKKYPAGIYQLLIRNSSAHYETRVVLTGK